MKHKCFIKTRYAETGQDGIIHHSAYVVYLEVARLDLLKKMGWDINELEKNKILCPVVDLSIRYIKPLRSLEDIEINIEIFCDSKVRMRFEYEILRKGELISKAKSTHCFINDNFKPIPLPKDLFSSVKNR